jgi:hypothetical protein
MPSLTESATEVRNQYDREAAAVRANRDLSDEGKDRALRELHADAKERMATLRARHEAEEADEAERLHRKAFGARRPPGGGGDATTITIRDAMDRAAGLRDQDHARSLLEQSKLAGDKSLARALAGAAWQRGWAGALERYVELFPEERESVDALIAYSRACGDARRRVATAMLFSAPPRARS